MKFHILVAENGFPTVVDDEGKAVVGITEITLRYLPSEVTATITGIPEPSFTNKEGRTVRGFKKHTSWEVPVKQLPELVIEVPEHVRDALESR